MKMLYRLGEIRVLGFLFFFGLSLTSWIWLSCANESVHAEIPIEKIVDSLFSEKEINGSLNVPNTPFPNEPLPKAQIPNVQAPAKKKPLYIQRELVFVETRRVWTTNYSQGDGEVEKKGWYSCHWDKEMRKKLPLQQERIQRDHFTVGLPNKIIERRKKLITLKDGTVDWEWLVHVPGYNYGKSEDGKDSPYFSRPRDKVGTFKDGKERVDCLITTAGKYNSIEQRQDNWKTEWRDVEFWQYQWFAYYKGGERKRVKVRQR